MGIFMVKNKINNYVGEKFELLSEAEVQDSWGLWPKADRLRQAEIQPLLQSSEGEGPAGVRVWCTGTAVWSRKRWLHLGKA